VPAALRRKSLLACLLAAAFLGGCGSDDPAPREAASTTTTTKAQTDEHGDSEPSEPTSSEDREKIVAVLGKMEAAINDGDADRLCSDVYAFAGDSTRSDCVKLFGTVLEQSEARAKITLRGVKRKGDRATVSVSNSGLTGGGSSSRTFRFIKRDDDWRVLFD